MSPAQTAALDDISANLIEARDLLLLCAMGIAHSGGTGNNPKTNSHANALFGVAKLIDNLSEDVGVVLGSTENLS